MLCQVGGRPSIRKAMLNFISGQLSCNPSNRHKMCKALAGPCNMWLLTSGSVPRILQAASGEAASELCPTWR